MKPCWKDAGLTEEGAARADAAIDRMTALVAEIGDDAVARSIFHEALFRVFELPKRTHAFQTKYKR